MNDLLTDQEKLAAIRIAEEAQRRIVSWAKWIFGVGTIVFAIFGFRAYSDFHSVIDNIDTKIEAKVNETVTKNVNEAVQKEVSDYKAFTKQFIDAIVEAKGKLQIADDELNKLEDRFVAAEKTISSFEKTLIDLENRAQVRYTEYERKVTLHISNVESLGVRVDLSISGGPGVEPDGVLSSQLWNYSIINLSSAWKKSKGSDSVVVAVLSTGILHDHPDLVDSPNIAPGYDMISDTFVANDGDGRDPDPTDTGDAAAAGECGYPTMANESSWHGTFLAGIIGAGKSGKSIGATGINWRIKVLPVRVLGKCGGTISDIGDGIRWAAGLSVAGLPGNPNPARVILLGFGNSVPCSQDPYLQNAINDAFESGAIVVVSAGNSGADASTSMPASCDNVLAVAASDARGHLAPYSNYGATVDILAPGGDLRRDDNGDGVPDGILRIVADGYGQRNGTSMAAAHVAGVAGLLLSQNPRLTPSELEAAIKTNALPRSETECPNRCGAGLLQAL